MDLPKVINIEKQEDRVELTLNICADLDVFKGHFDDAPIVPGIVQVAWALAFFNQNVREVGALEVTGLEIIKFQNVIPPEQIVTLVLCQKKNKLEFSFSSEMGKHSSGKIVIS